MTKKRCQKGKSCGATCIERRDDCVLELNFEVVKSIKKVQSKLRLGGLAFQIRKEGKAGDLAKFEAIRGQLAKEIGGRIDKQEHILELKRRLEKEGLLPKTKEEGLGDIFARNIQVGPPPKKSGPGEVTKLQDALGMGTLTRKEVGRDLKALRDEVDRQGIGIPATTRPKSTKTATLTGNTKWAREEGKEWDDEFVTLPGLKKIQGSKSSIDWNESLTKGTKLGEGSFGTAMLVKGASPYVVKRGEVSETEAPIIKKVGELGIGPKLIYAETAGNRSQELGVFLVQGRLAMGLVPGKAVEDISDRPTHKVNDKDTLADAYFKARATLHRAGIAHNDAHVGNVLIDDKGKARFVDLGLAQDHPKAALAEAIGVFATKDQLPRSAVLVRDGHEWGDFQAIRFPAFGVNKLGTPEASSTLTLMRDNKTDVFIWLRKQKGFTNDEIAALVTSGIRRPLSHYEKGVWGKLTNEDAKHLINLLYQGVS